MKMTVEFVVQLMLTGLMWIAFITSLAVKRAPQHREAPLEVTGRNLSIAGWLMFAGAASWALLRGQRISLDTVSMLSIAVLAFGCVVKNSALLLGINIGQPCSDCPFYQAADRVAVQPVEPMSATVIALEQQPHHAGLLVPNNATRTRRIG